LTASGRVTSTSPGRRRRSRSGWLLALAVALFAPCLGCSDQRLDWLPYETVERTHGGMQQIRDFSGLPTHIWADFDGDGVEEAILPDRNSVSRVAAVAPDPQVVWQHPFKPPFHRHQPTALLSVDFDLDGDGRPELLATACDTLRLRFQTHVIRLECGTLLASFELAMADGRFADGRWDGLLVPLGGVGRARGDGDLAVFVGMARYDVEGRGVLAVDPLTGAEVWRYETGPTIVPSECAIVDLDRDGRREILISGGGVGNRPAGELVNGASDDSSHVIVLDDRGNLRWRRSHAAYPSGVMIEVADVDGDGVQDLICGGGRQAVNESLIRIHDGATGRVLGELRGEQTVNGLVLGEGSAPGAVRLIVGHRDGGLAQYDVLRTGEFAERRRVRFPAGVSSLALADVVGDTGSEIVGRLRNLGVVFLSHSLETLAFLPYEGRKNLGPVHVWRLDDGRPRIQSGGHPHRAFYLRRARWPWLLGAGATVLAVPPVVFMARRRRRPSSEALRRELRLAILDRLQSARHERFGTLDNLARLEFYGASALEIDPTPAPPSQRIRQLVADTRETTLRRLEEVVALAREVEVPSFRCDSLADSCAKLDALLARCRNDAPLDLSLFLRELERVHRGLDVETARVREEVERCFQVALPPLLAGILRAQQPDLAATGVAVLVAGQPVDPAIWAPDDTTAVIGDPDDLGFVIDNLVGNAIRAMQEGRRRELTIDWRTQALAVTLVVSDTGCGIPQEDWSDVLAGRASTREGGGFGFRRTVEILRLFRGRLDITDSRPGQGTTFELTLARALDTTADHDPTDRQPATDDATGGTA
jgi:signal transduction histidine kinase